MMSDSQIRLQKSAILFRGRLLEMAKWWISARASTVSAGPRSIMDILS